MATCDITNGVVNIQPSKSPHPVGLDDGSSKHDPNSKDATSTSGTVSQMDETDSLFCGWFNIRPNWLQVFNTAPWLALTISLLMFVQGMGVSGFAFVSLTSIETRFQLPSVGTGLILSSYDLTALICLPFVSFFGASSNKPRLLGICTVILGFGFFLWTLPHFMSGTYEYLSYGEGYETICHVDANYTFYEDCHDDWTSLSNFFFLFVFAQIVVAIGASPIYNVGLALVDENVSTKNSGWYVGITHAFAVLGPVTGFILGAVFLSIYTDLLLIDSVDLTPDDPAWVGAWWLGFLISWLLAWLVAIPVGAYPSELPTRKEIEKERKDLAHQSDETNDFMKTKGTYGKSWKDFGLATKYILCNPAYMFIILAQCAQNLLLSGVAPFMPKFLENQFALTSTQGALIVGVTALPGAVGGTVLGGWIIRRFDLTVRGTIKFCILIAVSTIILLPVFLIHCPQDQIAGVKVPYEGNRTELDEVNLTHACNTHCQCSDSGTYDPICGTNGLVYFDACFAGCTGTSEDKTQYYDCSCIQSTNNTGSDLPNTQSPDAISGKCDVDCWQLPLFVILFFIVMLLGFCILTPYKYLTLRCVVDSQRSYALGMSAVFNKLFGSVPGPVLFGVIIDTSCLYWQTTCDTRGSCWIYDNKQFGLKFFAVGELFMFLVVIFFVLAHIFYKPPPDESVDSGGEEVTIQQTMSRDQLNTVMKGTNSDVCLIGYSKHNLDDNFTVF
ncbi:solute carrier organic anion transporter family member 4C1-like [Glandiceps talaboti]